ncbi:MAG: hypothetical protein MPJ78_16185 [Hyphomicrobiaceae bacterium]|nr:hypothetical protein [Hyphomicrobiaceae bacterium]
MRATQHNKSSGSAVRFFRLALAFAMALTLTGCSAASMTGFEFPVFGLTKKSAKNDETLSNAAIAERYPANPETAEQRLPPQ